MPTTQTIVFKASARFRKKMWVFESVVMSTPPYYEVNLFFREMRHFLWIRFYET